MRFCNAYFQFSMHLKLKCRQRVRELARANKQVRKRERKRLKLDGIESYDSVCYLIDLKSWPIRGVKICRRNVLVVV